MTDKKLITITVPLYNESRNIPVMYSKLKEILNTIESKYDFEILFINDGSTDDSLDTINKIAIADDSIRIIDFSRNFGKESAITAGLDNCKGDACIIIDADLQHPVELIPEFIKKWEHGSEVVVGVRTKNQGEGLIKKIGSFMFYHMVNAIAEAKIVPRSTDYRLLDRLVIDEFKKLTQKSRMARALIDWLGFKRNFIYFKANPRLHGESVYTILKLIKLALNVFMSHSLFPLRIAGYLGIFITLLSSFMGLLVFIDKFLLWGTFRFNFTGIAILVMFILFLVGIILICLGLIALYIGNIQTEIINRPVYIARINK
jgi:polyisoprenyl-phosphate glycosyltransferase